MIRTKSQDSYPSIHSPSHNPSIHIHRFTLHRSSCCVTTVLEYTLSFLSPSLNLWWSIIAICSEEPTKTIHNNTHPPLPVYITNTLRMWRLQNSKCLYEHLGIKSSWTDVFLEFESDVMFLRDEFLLFDVKFVGDKVLLFDNLGLDGVYSVFNWVAIIQTRGGRNERMIFTFLVIMIQVLKELSWSNNQMKQ